MILIKILEKVENTHKIIQESQEKKETEDQLSKVQKTWTGNLPVNENHFILLKIIYRI